MDVYDGVFLSADINGIYEATDTMNKYQEERRLFYVAMTRAINKLYVLSVLGKRDLYKQCYITWRNGIGVSPNKYKIARCVQPCPACRVVVMSIKCT